MSVNEEFVKLTKKQKAAILLTSLSPDLSVKIMRSLDPKKMKEISAEMSKLGNISAEIKAMVVEEFYRSNNLVGPASSVSQINAKSIGGSTLGSRLGTRFSRMKKMAQARASTSTVSPNTTTNKTFTSTTISQTSSLKKSGIYKNAFSSLKTAAPHKIYLIIKDEHPQLVALVLNYLQRTQASYILKKLSPIKQSDVAKRLAELRNVNLEVLQELEKVILEKISEIGEDIQEDSLLRSKSGGKQALVEILSHADRVTEQKILTGLTRKSPKLASHLKHKLWEFKDIANLDEDGIRQLLRVTDIRDLALALKGAPKEIAEKIYSSMPVDAASALREDVANLSDVDWDEIKSAQQQIRNNLRGLITIGKIKID